MKRVSDSPFLRQVICFVAVVLSYATGAWAFPTTADQARNMVQNWLSLEELPMGSPLGGQIKELQTFLDSAGDPAYYVVYLDPTGLVLVPADDLVEPVIGFLPEGTFDPSPTNPLGALVSQDIPGRVLKAREMESRAVQTLEALAPETPWATAQRKWDRLANSPAKQAMELGLAGISDVRVAPFVQSRWNQAGADGSIPNPTCNYPCYNYFTPPNAPGNTANYVSGCVATAMSQLIRYWQYPNASIGMILKTYSVAGSSTSGYTRGGDDNGGPYVWANMPLTTSSSTLLAERQAIGRLTWDAGIAVSMNYNTVAAGGSGADTLSAATAFVNTFGYSNAKRGYNTGNNIPSTSLNAMVNPNLHAQYPILFGITGAPGGHAIVCDGYGYSSATMYHHLNLGWSGSNDAWYNLPTVDTSAGTFSSVYKCVYNVYPTGTGEIIAGRVTDAGGTPLSGVSVTAVRSGGGTYNAVALTGSGGVYAISHVPSGSSFTISASKAGYTFASQPVNTTTSTDLSTTTGNVWGVDFVPSTSVGVTNDFNGDGKTDILWRNTESGMDVVWYMNGKDFAGWDYLLAVGDQAWSVVGTGYFNNDSEPDILWRNTSSGENVVWYMDGPTFIGWDYLPAVGDTAWVIVGTGYFNDDDKPDILWRNTVTGDNVVWYMDGKTFIGWDYLMTVADQAWTIVGTGYFNDDSKPDILWRNTSSGENVVWYMVGLTFIGWDYLPAVGDTAWTIAGTGYYNSDSKPEILWRNTSTGTNVVWYMNGATFIGWDYLLPPVSDQDWKIVGR